MCGSIDGDKVSLPGPRDMPIEVCPHACRVVGLVSKWPHDHDVPSARPELATTRAGHGADGSAAMDATVEVAQRGIGIPPRRHRVAPPARRSLPPLAGLLAAGGPFAGPLVLDAGDGEPDQLGDGVIAVEVAAGLGDLAELVVKLSMLLSCRATSSRLG